MAERQASDDTRPLEDVASNLPAGWLSPDTNVSESENPGGYTKLNEPVGGKVAPAKTNVGLRGRL